MSRLITLREVHRARRIGVGFEKADANGNVRLFWARSDLLRFSNDWRSKILARLSSGLKIDCGKDAAHRLLQQLALNRLGDHWD